MPTTDHLTSSPATAPVAARRPRPAGPGAGWQRPDLAGGAARRWGGWLAAGGAAGLMASFVLAVEKFRLLTDSTYVPTCSLNPVLSCGSVMSSPQAEAFGFPNPLLGLTGFTVVLVTGVLLAGGMALPGWYWAGLQIGASAAVFFVHWLIAASLYRIGALCPYCMVVWAVVIAVFAAVTARNLRAIGDRLPPSAAAVVQAVTGRVSVLVTGWLLVVAALIAVRFWTYWGALLG